MNRFKDTQGYIYYVSSIHGNNKYCIYRTLNIFVNVGVHIQKIKENLICNTAQESQKILNKEALRRGWQKYEVNK